MIAVVLILQLSIWVASTRAFFIWKPCHADNSCTPTSRRSVRSLANGAEEESAEALTFEIFERSHPVIYPHNRRAPRDFLKVSQKYARNDKGRIEAKKASLDKRRNEYEIVEPLEPKEANAVGIYQDASDYAYFVKAEIGSAKQPLYLLLDTGAGTTWIMGSKCTTEACQLHDTFDPALSSSRHATSQNFTIGYGSGTVGGDNVVDTIRLGEIELSMEFGVADQTSDHFKHFAFDGILGMSLNKGGTDNYPQSARENKKLAKNMFSVFLSRGSSGTNQGEITLGDINKNKYSGDITYTDVVSAGHGDWAIPIDQIAVAGNAAKLEDKRNGYIDTGTSYLFGPPGDVKGMHGLVDGATSDDGITWQVPCDTTQELSFTFSGKSYTVLPQDWVSPPDEGGACMSNVYGHEVVPKSWLLGAVFLKNVYTVFDYEADTARIGFAVHANPDKPKAPGTVSSQSPGITPEPDTNKKDGPAMGVGGHETSTVTGSVDQQPASTAGSSDSPSSGETVSSNHFLSSCLLAVATLFSFLGFL